MLVIQHCVILCMSVAVPDQEVEEDHANEVQATGRGQMDFRNAAHADLNSRSAVLLILERGRDVQQLAQILLMHVSFNVSSKKRRNSHPATALNSICAC